MTSWQNLGFCQILHKPHRRIYIFFPISALRINANNLALGRVLPLVPKRKKLQASKSFPFVIIELYENFRAKRKLNHLHVFKRCAVRSEALGYASRNCFNIRFSKRRKKFNQQRFAKKK